LRWADRGVTDEGENDIQARNIADPDTSRRCSDLQRSVLFATVETVSTELMNPTRHTAITLAERETGKPDGLVNCFIPDNIRHIDHRVFADLISFCRPHKLRKSESGKEISYGTDQQT
jgi:hypothetical protein